MEMEGPIKIDLLIGIIGEDDLRAGTVTIGMGMAHYPTREEMQARLEKFVIEEMPGGFRLMNKQEYFNFKFRELTGSRERFAVPGGREWDNPPTIDDDGTPI